VPGSKKKYLTMALDYFKFMKNSLALFPKWIINQYNLDVYARDGFVFLEIRWAVWGLPEAGNLANKLLRMQLAPYGYYECMNTPSLWKYATQSLAFSLVVDDFGIKYVGKEHANHLITCLKENCKLTKDLMGNLYCGITLNWNYHKLTLNIFMPKYINKPFFKYRHAVQ
jgi:hypothetical protein